MRYLLMKARQLGDRRAWFQTPHAARRAVFLGVVAIAICLQLADTSLDLGGLAEADSASANAAGLIGVFEFFFGCLAALLFRYHKAGFGVE